ncbi:MAG: hypothetical protein U1E65_08080 [Myxococcota bacterium]
MRTTLSCLISTFALVACGSGGSVPVGPEGGEVIRDGLRLHIPAGALEAVVNIDATQRTEGWVLSPDGLEFKAPIDVELAYRPEDDDGTMMIVHTSKLHGVEAIATSTDAEARVLRGQIQSFSSVQARRVVIANSLPNDARFEVLDNTDTTIVLHWYGPRDNPITGNELSALDGLGFHSDAEFDAVMRDVGANAVSTTPTLIEYRYTDVAPVPGFGRSYRLIPYLIRNGQRIQASFAYTGGFTRPTSAHRFNVGVEGDGVVWVDYQTTTATLTGPTSGTLACPPQCSTDFALGTEVTLRAVPSPGRAFLGWSGTCTSTTDTVHWTTQGPTSCVATFTRADHSASFFVTHVGFGSVGGHMGGLAGADRFCQAAALASTHLSASARARSWRAFLGTTCGPSNASDCVVALDRIGAGPWTSVGGEPVTRQDLIDGTVPARALLDEEGQRLPPLDDEVATGFGSLPANADLDGDGVIGERDGFLAFLMDADASAVQFGFSSGFCGGWTSNNAFQSAVVGHADYVDDHDSPANPLNSSLNATHSFTRNCSPSGDETTSPSGTLPRAARGWHLYCFAG